MAVTGLCYHGPMETPAYDDLNRHQQLAVRHMVFKSFKLTELGEEPGTLSRALESIASDPVQLQKALTVYGAHATQQAAKIAATR